MSRGVDFEAGGEVWTLRLSFNALCAIEAATKRPALEVLRSIDTADLTLFRTVFQCSLGRKVAAEKAGDLIEEIGIRRAGAIFGEALALAQPREEDAGEPEAEA